MQTKSSVLRAARRIATALVILLALAVAPAGALDIELEDFDLGPLGEARTLTLSGDIERGDAERVWERLRVLDWGVHSRLHIVFDSPGGSVAAAMELGRLLDALPTTVTVNVGRRIGELSFPGECASACVLAYLGGHYRYLDPRSRLGVHQFAFHGEGSLEGRQATAMSQMLAADVLDYMREMRVDPELFSLMSRTFPEDIHWIDEQTLRRLRVVTGHVYNEMAEYKNADGAFYLLLWQQSYYGENKIAAACGDEGILFMAFLQPPDLGFVEMMRHDLTVMIDGVEVAPATLEQVEVGDRFAHAAFTLSPEILRRLMTASRFGARMMVPGAGVFFGFEMDLPDGKLADTIRGCSAAFASTRSAPLLAPPGRGQAPMSRLPGYDLAGGDLLPSGIRNLSLEDCEAWCQREPTCLAITWIAGPRWCWPKRILADPRPAQGMISSWKP
jgi:hypothetical protein